MVHHSLWKHIARIEPRGSRIMQVRFNATEKLDIIATYAPPAESNNKATAKEAKQEYYDDLDRCVKETPRNHVIIVMGDMNASLIEATNDKEKRVIGGHALKGSSEVSELKEDTTRDNRDRLIEFCLSNELSLENTMF